MATTRIWVSREGFLAVVLLSFSLVARADDAAPPSDLDVIARYEQILEREPMEGPSFDKLLQIYEQGDGLEKLDARWTPLSTQPGAKGATYSLLRGLLADRMGKTDDARKLLQAATQGAPNDFHGWLALGDFESREGHWPDAIIALQKGLATPVTGDDRLSLYRKLGQAQERDLDSAAALATWQKMVDEFPTDPFAVEEAGSAELDAEQFDEAKKTFQKLVDLTEPNSMNRVQALMRLAEVDDRQGKTDAAVHDYEAILPLTAESSWLNRELRAQIEQVYRREDDLAGLVSYYQKWTQDNPKDVDAMLLLSGAETELGKKPEALDALRKAATLAPDRHEVRQSLAQGLVEAKQYDEAIAVETALTADDPTEPRYWETLGDALWLKTQPTTPDSTKATLDAWSHIDPPDSKDVAAILEVADLCHDHQLNDQALAGYQRALALTPDASDIREKAVKLLVDLKRQDEAWKLLDAMTDGPLATAGNYLKLAQLQEQFSRTDAATASIQKGLALDPKNFDLLSLQWSHLAEAQKWSDAVALYDKLIAAAPNSYFTDQIETRQVQALTSAGQLDAKLEELRAKLGSSPGMTEGELRLLERIMIEKSDADIAKAFDEAHRRFPQSVSLIQIEVDYDRHAGNYDAAVAALQQLIASAPQQKGDWLGELVRVRQDQGNMDEALKAAQQIIDNSPAGSDGYLLYAELALAAGKPDDAVTKMQAAIKLSDKPNDVRQRLGRYYLESGQAAKARTIYDDAFAAADNPQDKLTIVRAMADAYFQDGQVEELVNRFKQEQKSEDGGWRYGLYLSAIYEEMQDYGSARRELAKSLAVRPQDASLLHSLIGLADKEGDQGELLRYRQMLAEADPSAENELALANEYASQNKDAEAWEIIQKERAEVAKDPLAWKDVLNQITDTDYAEKIKSVLEEAIKSKGNSLEGNFALAQFQMQQGDLDGAKATLWEIMEAPLPPAPPPQPGAALKSTTPFQSSLNGIFGTSMMQRSQQSFMAMNEAQQLLASAQMRNQYRQMSMMRVYGQMGLTTVLTPQAIKDHALVYLSVIALQQKQADDFLKDLQAKFDAWHWSLSDKLVAYSIIQAREPLLQTIEAQAQTKTSDKELDQFCASICYQFEAQNIDAATRQRALAAQDLIIQRLSSDPQLKKSLISLQIEQMASNPNLTPDQVAKKKALMDDYLKLVDRQNAEDLVSAIEISAQTGNWDGIKQTADDLAKTDPNKWSLMVKQVLTFLPMILLQQQAQVQTSSPSATTDKDKDLVPVMLELMQLGYPSKPPRAMGGSQGGMFGYGQVNFGFYNQNTFPPSNRYFPPNQLMMLQPVFQQLKSRNLLPEMYTALDSQEKELGDWRKIYPQLLRIYFQWWDDKKDDATASVRTLLQQDPSDDYKLLLASMLTQQQKYDEAIPVLESVTARFGPTYINVETQLLHTARLAKNNDVGQKAASRLLALRLPQQQQMQIMDDLRAVGLKDKADEIMAHQQNGMTSINNMNATIQADQQLMMTLENAINRRADDQVLTIAHQILNRDPLAAANPNGYNGMAAVLREQSLEGLKRIGKLDDYVQDVDQQLAASPNSVKLNWLAAEAYQHMSDRSEQMNGAAPLPQWLKIQRTGNTVEGFYSFDGTNWTSTGSTAITLAQKVCVGFWSFTATGQPPVISTFDRFTLTGKTSAEPPPSVAPAPPPTLTPTPTTNAPSTNSPPSTPIPPPTLAPTPTPMPTTSTTTVTTPGGGVVTTVRTLTGYVTGAAPPSTPPPAPPAPVATTTGPVPTPWHEADIGTQPEPGSAGAGADNTILLTEKGVPFAPSADGLHYVFQTLDGNGSLVTRVVSQTGSGTKATGLMVRATLDPGSPAAAVAFNSRRSVTWQTRSAASDSWSIQHNPEFTVPAWLRLTRKGNTFTGSYSRDGQNWTDIFSEDVAMSGGIVGGMILSPDTGQTMQAAWKDLKVTGAAPATTPSTPAAASTTTNTPPTTPATTSSPPASASITTSNTSVTTTSYSAPAPAVVSTLPAPWQYSMVGNPTAQGGAHENNGELTMTATATDSGNNSRANGFVYQPVPGDGEIVAQLESITPPDAGGRAGLCFRAGTGDDAMEVDLLCNEQGEAGYYIRNDAADRALQLYQKVAKLDPKNQQALIHVAEQLRQQGHPDKAADIYTTILKADFANSINQYYAILQVFEQANRLGDFVKIIEDWTQPPPNPMGGGQDMFFMIAQIGDQLQQNHHLPEAERVYRKALTMTTFQPKINAVSSLAQVLIDENRPQDASAEIEKWMEDKGTAPPTPQPILGFNNVQVGMQNSWFMAIGYSQNGEVNAPIVHLLEMADDLGLGPKLRKELEAKAATAQNSSAAMFPGQIDQYRLAGILLSILDHDPGYRPEMEKLLKDYPATTPAGGNNVNAFLILSQELLKWPGEEPMALRLAQQAYDCAKATMANNFFFSSTPAFQVVRIARATGDHKTAQATLKELADSLRQQRAMNNGMVQTDQSLKIIQGMIQEGMYKDANDLLADVKTDPQLANNTYYQQQVDGIEKDLAMQMGTGEPASLTYGLTTGSDKGKSGGLEFAWELRGETPHDFGPYNSNTSWAPEVPATATTCKIEVKGGPDEDHLTHLAMFENVAVRGSAPIKIPEGTLILQATLLPPKPAATSTTNPPPPSPLTLPPAMPKPIMGQLLLLGGGPNLLQNPDLKPSKNAAGTLTVPGWQGVGARGVTEMQGGPPAGGPYQMVEPISGFMSTLTADKIPIKANTDYVLSAWMTSVNQFALHFLDADGKVLTTRNLGIGSNSQDWSWRSVILRAQAGQPKPFSRTFPGRRRNNYAFIPPNTAFLELSLMGPNELKLSGLSFRQMPSTDPAPPTPPPPVPTASGPAPKPAAPGAN